MDKETNKGGRPKVWTEDRVSCIEALFERFLKNDKFFIDENYEEISEVIPLLAHFVATLGEKWETVREEYPELAEIKRPPSKMTIINMETMKPLIDIMKVRQERGLIYGTLSGVLSGSTAALMLQNHGYVQKNKNEVDLKANMDITVSRESIEHNT